MPAAVALVLLFLRDRSAKQDEKDRSDAVAAARVAVRDILSYDYRQIDNDIAQAKADSVAPFLDMYSASATKLLGQAKQLKAIVQATVGSDGIVSSAHDQVVVLLFVDQAAVRQTPGKKSPTTRIYQNRVRMTMTKVDGKWKVSQLNSL